MSMFNADAFLQGSVTGAMDTKIIPCPEGDYLGVITGLAARQWNSKDGSKTGIALDVTWTIEDQGVKDHCARSEVTVRQSIMLDCDDNLQLEVGPGKNIGLGRLREATGQNDPSRPFSFGNLQGQMAKVGVKHRVDDRDNETIYAEVKSVVKPN